jgi:hypothetical protein
VPDVSLLHAWHTSQVANINNSVVTETLGTGWLWVQVTTHDRAMCRDRLKMPNRSWVIATHRGLNGLLVVLVL